MRGLLSGGMARRAIPSPSADASIRHQTSSLTPPSTPPNNRSNLYSVATALMPEAQSQHREAKSVPYPLRDESAPCFTVEQFLSQEECERLIEISETVGYEAALVNVGGGRQVMMNDVRKSSRAIIDCEAGAAILWRRLRSLMPQPYARWKAVGLNERFRFLKYEPGDYFAPHRDGAFRYEHGPRQGEVSFMTVMLYLNAPKEGGETNFLNPRNNTDVVQVKPHAGLALIFDHGLFHEGAMLKDGVKYAIRTDIMFRRSGDTSGSSDLSDYFSSG